MSGVEDKTTPQVAIVQASVDAELSTATPANFNSKRRERGDSVATPTNPPSGGVPGTDIKSSKRHRLETTEPGSEKQQHSIEADTIKNDDAFKTDLVGCDPNSDSDSDDDDFEHNSDSDVNIDGSCAPSPFNGSDPISDVEQIPFTRFTAEQIEIIRGEAHALGMKEFLQHYVVEKAVPVRALLEVFGAPPMLCASVAGFQLLPLLKNQLLRFYRNRPKIKHINTVQNVVDLLKKSRRIMVLTGAGVSVSCGIPDFRSPTGIYTRLNDEFGLDDPQQMFDIEYFREIPELFYSFAKELYPYNFTPAPTHAFVKMLEDKGKLLRNYTQNIDTLEHVQGIKNVLNCHGSFATATCIKCGYKCDGKELESDIMAMRIAYCPICNDRPAESSERSVAKKREMLSEGYALSANHVFDENNNDDDDDEDDDDYGSVKGIMKPDITFFGEKLPDQFDEALLQDRDKVDLLLVMGSSLKVAPVSDIMGHLPHTVPQIVINKTPILHLNFDVQLLGDADDIVAYLARACGWELKHLRVPGGSTNSRDYTNMGSTPILSPPSMAIPIKVSNNRDQPIDREEIVEKVYKVPEHWHLFTSAVVTAKDLYMASGDKQVRLAGDSSDEEDESEISSNSSSNDDDDKRRVDGLMVAGEQDEGDELAKEMVDTSLDK
ncbi:NAD-dependent histone deacetylase sir2 [Coemansia sp. RSA 1286]|nr:NAD-dependent histone deacetylase sir2 [Coemansia sp. RSA 1286]